MARKENEMEGTIKKDGRKWVILGKDGNIIFMANTRVGCFRYAAENGIKIKEYQHGGE